MGLSCKFKNYHRNFQDEMARDSPIFRNKQQLMVETGKECCFPSNFDMPWPFTQRKTELPRKME